MTQGKLDNQRDVVKNERRWYGRQPALWNLDGAAISVTFPSRIRFITR